MKNIFLSIVFLLFCTCAFAQRKQKGPIVIEDPIVIELMEYRSGEISELYVLCSSGKFNYPTSLKYSLQETSTDVRLSFLHIAHESDPFKYITSIPAKAQIGLWKLADGEYNFEISVNKFKGTGKLIIAADEFRIDFPLSDEIQFKNTSIKRTPIRKMEEKPVKPYKFVPDTFSIGSGVKINLVEYIDSTKRSVMLNCSSELFFSATPFIINYTLTKKERKITVKFTSVTPACNVCGQMFSPASAAVNLGDLPAGTYDLEIQVLGVSALNNTAVNYGKLTVSKEKLQVDFKSQQGINFLNTSLNRFPDNISWLVIDVPDPLTASLVQSFADSLKTIGAVFPLKLPDGEYYLFPNRMYFKVSAFNIGPLTSEQGYRSTNQLIIFRSPENLDALKQYYTDWKSRYKGLYFASLYSIQNNCYFGPYRK